MEKESINYYRQYGIKSKGMYPVAVGGCRFDIFKHKVQKGEKENSFTVTLSKPSSEIVCVRKTYEKTEIGFCIQSRAPYLAEVDKNTYVRLFIEQPAGLLEEGETFEEGAIREAEEETGYKVKSITSLIKPKICRHVSYSDETSKVFLAIMGEKITQKLDETEDCKFSWYSIDEAYKNFEDYLEGNKETFFGFDIPDMTILALQRFFLKYHRGELDLL